MKKKNWKGICAIKRSKELFKFIGQLAAIYVIQRCIAGQEKVFSRWHSKSMKKIRWEEIKSVSLSITENKIGLNHLYKSSLCSSQ